MCAACLRPQDVFSPCLCCRVDFRKDEERLGIDVNAEVFSDVIDAVDNSYS
jgi:hypothetical protein